MTKHSEAITVFIEPTLEPRPLTDQSFVSDFHRIGLGGHQAGVCEALEQ